MATIGCGISHKNRKHTDKCRNNKTKTTQKQYDETTDKYFFSSKYREYNTKFDTKYTHIIQGSYNKQ
jgi:hypothetical protein